jgi:hypothetical protein
MAPVVIVLVMGGGGGRHDGCDRLCLAMVVVAQAVVVVVVVTCEHGPIMEKTHTYAPNDVVQACFHPRSFPSLSLSYRLQDKYAPVFVLDSFHLSPRCDGCVMTNRFCRYRK